MNSWDLIIAQASIRMDLILAELEEELNGDLHSQIGGQPAVNQQAVQRPADPIAENQRNSTGNGGAYNQATGSA